MIPGIVYSSLQIGKNIYLNRQQAYHQSYLDVQGSQASPTFVPRVLLIVSLQSRLGRMGGDVLPGIPTCEKGGMGWGGMGWDEGLGKTWCYPSTV